MIDSIRKLSARVAGIVRRGVLGGTAGDGTVQVATVADNTRDRAEKFEPYGFASNPESGAECLVFQVNGDPSHVVVLAAGDRSQRVEINAGEVAVYNRHGASIILRANGAIEIDAGPSQAIAIGGTVAGTATFHAAIAELVRSEVIASWTAATPAAGDGGAALKSSALVYLNSTGPTDWGASQVQVAT